jgi:hypothetical protein
MNKPELVERVALAIEEAIQPMYLLQGYKRAAATAAIEELGVERLVAALAQIRELTAEPSDRPIVDLITAYDDVEHIATEALSSLSQNTSGALND